VDYKQESGAAIHRRRRHQRAALTLTVVTLLLLGTFVYSAAYVQGWIGNRATSPGPNAACPRTTSAKAVTPRLVTINVYNATSRDGLAASVAEQLQSLGFKVAKVSNDPLSQSITGVAEIRRGPSGAAGGALVATRLAGAKAVVDERTDETVDVVLGSRFTKLSTPSRAAIAKAAKAVPAC
jgi:LytR cell envelope-related transcriptional attenuator